MKFLVDNQLPIALCSFLLQKGHDAEHVLKLGMERASDLEISLYAAQRGSAIITKDEDFSVLAAVGRCTVSVLWVRVGNCRSRELVELFSHSLDKILERLQMGERVIQLID